MPQFHKLPPVMDMHDCNRHNPILQSAVTAPADTILWEAKKRQISPARSPTTPAGYTRSFWWLFANPDDTPTPLTRT